jgi:fluoride ion exporter CrcB/FEX
MTGFSVSSLVINIVGCAIISIMSKRKAEKIITIKKGREV